MLLFIILLFGNNIYSQMNISNEVSSVDNVDLIELPALDNTVLRTVNTKNNPNTFAEARAVDISTKTNGTWESVKGGDIVWRQRIKSPNAFSINLGFTEFKLEKDVRLFLYNLDKSEIIGPFTDKDNDDHLQLWTPMISGDEIVLEIQGSSEAISKSQLLLSSVNHDFVDVKSRMLSGSCNIDVACSAEDGYAIIDNYRDIISSVGAFTLNGINQCSGMLVNNTAMDCKPYFITANHCGVSNINSSTVVVYWNYENQTCRPPNSFQSGQPGNGSRAQFNSGSVLRANSAGSDFALLELDDEVDPRLNLFFSGWDLSGELTDTSICIHHPNVEEKRISFDFDPMIYETGTIETDYIRVLDWDLGTTEPGSSGSPIFNSRKQFIGQLNGGFAACGNNEHDSFGYFNYSWDNNIEDNRSLKSWLDPLSTGERSIDGVFCGLNLELSANNFDFCRAESNTVTIDILPSSFFDTTLEYSTVEIPTGLTLEFEKESSVGTEENSITISGFENVTDGEYTFVIVANDGANNIEATIVINLFSNIPETPELIEPANNSENVSLPVVLKLKRSSNVRNEFQLALDSEFNNLIFQEVTSFVLVPISNLSDDTEYFWRSRAMNICGTSDWSAIYNFKTELSFCTQINALDGPIVIDDVNENEVISKININYPVKVQDVNVANINGTHTFIEDLYFTLSFNQNDVLLVNEICGNMDDFNFGFDDESLNNQVSCPPTSGELFVPRESLELYDGMLAGGQWELKIEDMVIDDGGMLNDWTIEICFNETEAAVIVPEFHKYSFCENQLLSINAYFNTNNITSDFDVKIYNIDGENIVNSYFENSVKSNQLLINIQTQLLTEVENQVQIVLEDKTNSEVIALSSMNLERSGNEQVFSISSPREGEIIEIDGFEIISWDGDFDGISRVEISRNEQFDNLEYSESIENLNSIDVSHLSLLPGLYFLRVINSYDCGEVSAQVVSFTIDEVDSVGDNSNSYFSLTLFPNPTDGLIYIKNENQFEQQTIIQLFDVSGRYFEPKLQYVSPNLVILDLSDKAEGVYFIKLMKSDKSIQKMIFKSQ